jgi:putative Holliday junction resolvase
MRVMGLDIGDKRIGVALSDPGEILASPFTIIERNDEEHDIGTITDIITQHEVGKIIVGLPRSMAGTIGHQAAKVEAFVERLRSYTQIPMEFQDERLSTVSARQLLQLTGRKTKMKPRYDAAAAAIILQDYLEEQR